MRTELIVVFSFQAMIAATGTQVDTRHMVYVGMISKWIMEKLA